MVKCHLARHQSNVLLEVMFTIRYVKYNNARIVRHLSFTLRMVDRD